MSTQRTTVTVVVGARGDRASLVGKVRAAEDKVVTRAMDTTQPPVGDLVEVREVGVVVIEMATTTGTDVRSHANLRRRTAIPTPLSRRKVRMKMKPLVMRRRDS